MSDEKNVPRKKHAPNKCWEFDPVRNMWMLIRIPEVHPANMTAGYLLTHVGGVVFPEVSLYVFAAVGMLLSVAVQKHLFRLITGAASIAAVPVIVRVVDDGAAHVARIDWANLGPVGVIIGCVAVVELLRRLYPRCKFTVCLPAYVTPKTAPSSTV